MQTEIVDVGDRCPACRGARRLFLRDEGLTESGDLFVAYRSERIPHSREECQRLVTLAREEWPVLPFDAPW